MTDSKGSSVAIGIRPAVGQNETVEYFPHKQSLGRLKVVGCADFLQLAYYRPMICGRHPPHWTSTTVFFWEES